MTLFWIAAAVLTFAVVAVLLPPLLKPRAITSTRADHDLEVYRDQLKELDREVERGLITPAQSEAARAEIGRRMLSVAEETRKAKKGTVARVPKGSRTLALFLTVLIPVGALAVYLPLGHPDLPAQPLASRSPATGKPPKDVLAAVGKMVEHLKQNPQDSQAWMLLGQVYGRMERWDDSLDAYRKAKALIPHDPEAGGALAEALVSANRGIVPEEAAKGFDAVLAVDPKNPRARFYLALARMQAGDFKGALDRWVALAADGPADAPWLPSVQRQIGEVAQRLGVDVATVMPKTPPVVAPTAAPTGAPALSDQDMAAARTMDPDQRDQMVQTMVERLANRLRDNPADADGWLRLAQSYDVLGEKDKADEAARKAVEQAPRRVEVLLAYADRLLAELPEGSAPGPLPPAFIKVIKDVQAIAPDSPDVLWFLGLEAANTGKPAEAKEFWDRLLAKLDPASEDHAALKARIAALN